MKIRTRILLGMILLVGVGAILLVNWISEDLEPRYRESMEEPLVDFATSLAALAETQLRDGAVTAELFRQSFANLSNKKVDAQIYGYTKKTVDIRVYITDQTGKVVFDSENGKDEGKDYSQWRDVKLTLSGQYGARTSHEKGDGPSTMYVSAPIRSSDGRIAGVVSVGKPTTSSNEIVSLSRNKILLGTLVVGALILVLVFVMAEMVTRPLTKLSSYARAIRDKKRVSLPKLGTSEVAHLGTAFEEMRIALEGAAYIEKYVQTLTHEIKSPLSGIKGAAEILRDELTEERRSQFLNNIQAETMRLETLVEKLLALSTLENKKNLNEKAPIDLLELIHNSIDSHRALFDSKELKLRLQANDRVIIQGDKFWLEQAVHNLFQNSFDFSSVKGTINIGLSKRGRGVELFVEDSGTHIPEYALTRVFEPFYSLKRPDTGKKSSGLGLTLVKEICELHGGSVQIENRESGGVRVTLTFSREPSVKVIHKLRSWLSKFHAKLYRTQKVMT